MEIISDNINIDQIAESGQCFRMNQIEKNTYSLIAFEDYIELTQLAPGRIGISGGEEKGKNFWEEYFDCGYDYRTITDSLLKGEDEFLKSAADFGSGLRILKQDPFETLISFIISQNKNIPAIKNAIERICERYGKKKQCKNNEEGYYFTFPEAEVLAEVKRDELRSLGLGYRDEYIEAASATVAKGKLNLEKLGELEWKELMDELMSIKGVGKKVASCVALFGFHKMNVAPEDVWIKRINEEIYGGKLNWEIYGNAAGLVQQYMFYYVRSEAYQKTKYK